MEQIDGDSVILTLGDSFSQQGRFGYQNYLAQLYSGYKVYNLNLKNDESHSKSYQYFVDLLLNDAELPSIVIFESVERYLTQRLVALNFSVNKCENITDNQCYERPIGGGI